MCQHEVSRLTDELRRLMDRNAESQQHGEDAFTVQELDRLTEHHRSEMEALRLQREALVLDAPRMMSIVVSSSETQLHQLWLQVQQLVTFPVYYIDCSI